MTAKVFFSPPSLPFNTAEIIQRREERAARRSLPADIVLCERARVCVCPKLQQLNSADIKRAP